MKRILLWTGLIAIVILSVLLAPIALLLLLGGIWVVWTYFKRSIRHYRDNPKDVGHLMDVLLVGRVWSIGASALLTLLMITWFWQGFWAGGAGEIAIVMVSLAIGPLSYALNTFDVAILVNVALRNLHAQGQLIPPGDRAPLANHVRRHARLYRLFARKGQTPLEQTMPLLVGESESSQ